MASAQSLFGLMTQLQSNVASILIEASLKLCSLTDINIFFLIETADGRRFAGNQQLCDQFRQGSLLATDSDIECIVNPTVSALEERGSTMTGVSAAPLGQSGINGLDLIGCKQSFPLSSAAVSTPKTFKPTKGSPCLIGEENRGGKSGKNGDGGRDLDVADGFFFGSADTAASATATSTPSFNFGATPSTSTVTTSATASVTAHIITFGSTTTTANEPPKSAIPVFGTPATPPLTEESSAPPKEPTPLDKTHHLIGEENGAGESGKSEGGVDVAGRFSFDSADTASAITFGSTITTTTTVDKKNEPPKSATPSTTPPLTEESSAQPKEPTPPDATPASKEKSAAAPLFQFGTATSLPAPEEVAKPASLFTFGGAATTTTSISFASPMMSSAPSAPSLFNFKPAKLGASTTTSTSGSSSTFTFSTSLMTSVTDASGSSLLKFGAPASTKVAPKPDGGFVFGSAHKAASAATTSTPSFTFGTAPSTSTATAYITAPAIIFGSTTTTTIAEKKNEPPKSATPVFGTPSAMPPLAEESSAPPKEPTPPDATYSLLAPLGRSGINSYNLIGCKRSFPPSSATLRTPKTFKPTKGSSCLIGEENGSGESGKNGGGRDLDVAGRFFFGSADTAPALTFGLTTTTTVKKNEPKKSATPIYGTPSATPPPTEDSSTLPKEPTPTDATLASKKSSAAPLFQFSTAASMPAAEEVANHASLFTIGGALTTTAPATSISIAPPTTSAPLAPSLFHFKPVKPPKLFEGEMPNSFFSFGAASYPAKASSSSSSHFTFGAGSSSLVPTTTASAIFGSKPSASTPGMKRTKDDSGTPKADDAASAPATEGVNFSKKPPVFNFGSGSVFVGTATPAAPSPSSAPTDTPALASQPFMFGSSAAPAPASGGGGRGISNNSFSASGGTPGGRKLLGKSNGNRENDVD